MKRNGKLFLSVLMVFMLVLSMSAMAFATDDAEEVVEITEAVEEPAAPVEEAPAEAVEEAPAAAAPASSSVNRGALSTALWGVGFLAVGVLLIVLSNNKTKKGKKRPSAKD